MNKKLLQKLKQRLEEEKSKIEENLKSFAKKDEKLDYDWDTRFPKFDGGESGGSALEKAADEVEEYSNLLSVEYALEVELKKVIEALEKIKKGRYGICEKCGKEISQARLRAYPQAKYCEKCQ